MAPSCKGQVVRRNQRSQLMLAMQARNQVKNHFSGATIEVASRLIGEEHLRLRYECASQRQPLLFTAGEFA